MTSYAGSRRSRPVPTGVHLFDDPNTVELVLTDSTTFRAARLAEHVPGWSRSFFLATDISDESSAPRCRKALVAYLSPKSLKGMRSALDERAQRVVDRLPSGTPFDVQEQCLRPYSRRTALLLSGLPLELGRRLIGAVRVAVELKESDPPSSATVQRLIWRELLAWTESDEVDAASLTGFALKHGLVTSREAALLALPPLEMAALDMNTAVASVVLRRVASGLAPKGLATRQLRGRLWAATAELEGLLVTRVATKDVELEGRRLSPGERVILDLSRANAVLAQLPGGSSGAGTFAFGLGEHACVGRELAILISECILAALVRRGVVAVQGQQPTLADVPTMVRLQN